MSGSGKDEDDDQRGDRRRRPGGETLLGTIKAGDALVYDARTIHRGRGFSLEGGGERPTLVLRWDDPETPAPGQRLVGTMIDRCVGKVVSAFSSYSP
jgi:hypothetical protein